MGGALKVLLAEDVAMVRGALVALIELEPDMKVESAVDRGDDIVPQALAHAPHIAIIDINLPGIDGLTAASQLYRRLPSCRTLILASLSRKGDLRRALTAHVWGYLLEHVARYFADHSRPRGIAEFGITGWSPGPQTGAPVLHDSLAWLECELTTSYGGGDHEIFVGSVLASGFGTSSDALLFFGGSFHRPRLGRPA
jgi:CheY-like chemotaxis protein